jgi:hypothetical protein
MWLRLRTAYFSIAFGAGMSSPAVSELSIFREYLDDGIADGETELLPCCHDAGFEPPMLSAGIRLCIGLCVLSDFHPGSSRWKRICLLGTLLNQTKLPPRRARRRAAMWNRRRDLVARPCYHPRKVDGVPAEGR